MPHCGPVHDFKTQLKAWRGNRLQKEAAADLDVSLGTYRKWEYGKRTPTKITLAEILRRMGDKPEHTRKTVVCEPSQITNSPT